MRVALFLRAGGLRPAALRLRSERRSCLPAWRWRRRRRRLLRRRFVQLELERPERGLGECVCERRGLVVE